MSNGLIHFTAPIMLQGSTSTPCSLTPVVLDLMSRLWMDSSHVFKGWCQVCKNARRFLKKWKYIRWQLEHLTLTWLFKTRKPKCQVSFILFQISTSFLMLLLFVVDAWWTNYGSRIPNLQKLDIQVLSQTCNSSKCQCNRSVFEKINTKKRNRLKNFKLNFEFTINYNFTPRHPLNYVL
jgi:hypothetical protein